GGGGGRVALISSDARSSFTDAFAYPTDSSLLTTFKSRVRARGGSGASFGPNGGAGTVYLQTSESTHGDLILDNGGISHFAGGGTSLLTGISGTIFSVPNANSLRLMALATGTGLSANYNDILVGTRLRPNLAADGNTPLDPTDDQIVTVTG